MLAELKTVGVISFEVCPVSPRVHRTPPDTKRIGKRKSDATRFVIRRHDSEKKENAHATH